MISLLIVVAISGAAQVVPDMSSDPTVLTPRAERLERTAPPEEATEEEFAGPKSKEWKLHDQSTLAFKRIDQNGDDIVTPHELQSYYRVLYSRADLSRSRIRDRVKKAVSNYMHVFDADESGDVSFAEVVDGGMLRDRRIERSSQTFS